MRRVGASGLTLIEVVAAVALLSVLTVAVLPLLIDATQAIAPRAPSVDSTDLRAFSDQVLKDEKALAGLKPGEEQRLEWDARGASRIVTIDCVPGADAKSLPHDWIRFSCGNVRVLRFLVRGDAASVSTTGASQ